jgi:serine/threonine protein kinase
MTQGFKPPTPEELNPFFPSFEVTEFIAQGGMGAVFRATQISLDRPVAIKILPYEMGLDSQFSINFETEAKAMAKLNHPNLVQVFDFGNIDGMLYIVMELVPGRSLFDSAHGKSVEMNEACRLISAMCRGLKHAHDARLIHRDIKPANVLIDDSARPKIVDFGLARPLDNTHDGGAVYGTKGYTAPEVVRDPENIDQRADIFSVGVMLYELLTGQMPPYPYIPASSLSDSDPAFDTIILKAIHPKREFRYPDVGEMAEELDELALQLETAKNQPPPQASTPTSHRVILPKNRIQVKQPSSAPTTAIVIIALILVAAGITFAINQSSNENLRREQAQIELLYEQQVEKAAAHEKAALDAKKSMLERTMRERERLEIVRQQRISREIEEDRKLAKEERRVYLEERKERALAIEQQKMREAAEKAAALAAENEITEFDHLGFISEMRKLIANNSADTIAKYDTSLTKNIERYIRSSKRVVRKFERKKRRTAELQTEHYYKEILGLGRIPAKLNGSLWFLKDEHLESTLEQKEIDREFAPDLEVWSKTYISNCQKKSKSLNPEAHAESILYITKEVELTEENWQRILLIAKAREVEEPHIERDEPKKNRELRKRVSDARIDF